MSIYLMTTITEIIKYLILDKLKDASYKWLSQKLSSIKANEKLKEIRTIQEEAKKLSDFGPWTIMLILTNLI